MSDIYSSLSAHSRTFPKIPHNPASTSSKDHRYYTLDTRRDVQSRCVIKDDVDVGGWGGWVLFIPVDPRIVYGNNPPQERIPSSAPGTSSTHRIPDKVERVAIYGQFSDNNKVNSVQGFFLSSFLAQICVWSVKGTFSRYFNNSSFINLSSSSDRLNPTARVELIFYYFLSLNNIVLLTQIRSAIYTVEINLVQKVFETGPHNESERCVQVTVSVAPLLVPDRLICV